MSQEAKILLSGIANGLANDIECIETLLAATNERDLTFPQLSKIESAQHALKNARIQIVAVVGQLR